VPPLGSEPRTAATAPTRRRGFAFMACGMAYAGATVGAGTWLASGWVAWGVVISGIAAGAMLVGLGGYIVHAADGPAS